ncbi:MAG: hypothetical protein WC833_00125 [Bacteroidales bacterium]|jgi:hypothetical protein
MKKILFQFFTVALMAVLVIGCAKAPKAELAAATAAIDSAKVFEADRYLATEFNALQDSLNAINVAVEEQKSKMFFSRDYKAINEKLVTITSEIGTLKAKTEERKAQVRTEVQDTLNLLNALILEDKALLAKAPKGKEGKAALEAIQNDITVLDASVTEINTLITNGDYLTAQDKTTAAKVKAEAIKEELSVAIGKRRR